MMSFAGVDMVSSYAHRRGESIHVVLSLPGTAVARGTSVPVRLTRVECGGDASETGSGALSRSADVKLGEAGVTLDLAVQGTELDPGVWDLAIRLQPAGPWVTVGARLVTVGGHPVGLTPLRTPSKRRGRRRSVGQRLEDRSMARRVRRRARRTLRTLRGNARRWRGGVI
jgi:hypothetical protein